jgi:hypothetical protein
VSGNNGCVCYLANHTPKAVSDLVQSLQGLQKYYRRSYPCRVLIFHEAEMTQDMKSTITHAAPGLQLLEIKFPDAPASVAGLSAGAIGYRHMCHFFANDIFYHEALQPYAYYMRLDTDSQILGPINYDIFDSMAANNQKYGYITEFMDQPSVADGLWPCVQKYLDTHPEVKPLKQLYTDILQYRCYYTNFEVCNIAWFKQGEWPAMFRAVDEAGGIYTIRWGDHIIRFIGVNMFMQKAEIRHFKDIKYWHQGAFNC